jgi:hypothetical protein
MTQVLTETVPRRRILPFHISPWGYFTPKRLDLDAGKPELDVPGTPTPLCINISAVLICREPEKVLTRQDR